MTESATTQVSTYPQLARCTSTLATTPTATLVTALQTGAATCRVLANYVDATTSQFQWDTNARVVTPQIEILYQHYDVPGAQPTPGRKSGLLSSQVKLRNPGS